MEKNKLSKALDKLWHDMSLAELKKLHDSTNLAKLSYHDTLYLNMIDCYPNKYTSSKIADLLKITRPSVTQRINELEKKGYVVRTQSIEDKRVFYLSLNPRSDYVLDISQKEENNIYTEFIQKFGAGNLNLFCEMIDFISSKSEVYIKHKE